ncbi:hypothetical protein G6F24_018131 [Rhizopus arrhizus]|nr:hypothetical protein G6F24_018131 [Rhizopus arrhizus]
MCWTWSWSRTRRRSKGRRFGPLSGCPSAVRARACSCWTPALTPPCAGSQVVAHCGVAAVAGEIPLGERQVQPRRDHEGAEARYVQQAIGGVLQQP